MQFTGKRYFLTVNAGSSSLKINIFNADNTLNPVLKGSIQDIGSDGSLFLITTGKDQVVKNTKVHCDSVATAARLFAQWLLPEKIPVTAVGYRIVQGGTAYRQPTLIDAAFLEYLGSIQSLAPTHIPDEKAVIHLFMEAFPEVRHIACFDTFFHRTLPPQARYYPLPRSLWNEGVQKYGFHGLSYEYIMQYLQQAVPHEANGKIVIAHLGNGSSLAAVHNGVSVDTTMGMTPIGGLMMSTRCGDIDPGVLLYLLTQKHIPPEKLEHLLSHESGLKGVSGISGDMEALLNLEPGNPEVAEALDLFCYHIKKMTAAMAAVLSGLDMLVFTGGIGAHAPAIRSRVCNGLQYLGVRVNPDGHPSSGLISSTGSAVKVWALKTDEAYMIAKHMQRFI